MDIEDYTKRLEFATYVKDTAFALNTLLATHSIPLSIFVFKNENSPEWENFKDFFEDAPDTTKEGN